MSKLRYLFICLHLWILCEPTFADTTNTSPSDPKLVKTIVLFRHGMRAPLQTYKFDPYAAADQNLWPEGFGTLVNEGKNQMYMLGKSLRERYANLLLPYRNVILEDVKIVTTDVDRCYRSGALVLAGFYPPNEKQTWNKELLWQPIPIRSHSEDKSYIIAKKDKCPAYRDELFETFKIKKNDTNVGYLINFLSNFSHLESVKTAYDLFHFGDYVRTKRAMNLKLPDWANDDFLNRLNEFYVDSFNYLTFTPKMRQLLAGPLIKDIILRIQEVIYNKPENSKFFFYSGHDTSLIALFDGFGLERDFVPTFGASFIFEVYRSSSNNYLIRILFSHDHSMSNVNMKKLPNCDEYCPMGKFMQLFEKYYNQTWEKECNL